MTSFIQNFSRKAAASDAQSDPRVARVLEILRGATNAATEEQIRITEIPAPPFQESVRAAYMKKLFASTGLRVETDDVGNVIGEWAGTSPEVIMVTAHMDTVFPENTDVHVKREGGRLLAPGISDNGTGLAALVEWGGWKPVVLTVAACCAALIPLVYVLVPERPASIGLRSFGSQHDDHPAPPAQGNPFTAAFSNLARAATTRTFWFLFTTFFICGFTTNGLVGTHLIAFCSDHGIVEVQAASLLALMGFLDLAS